MDEAMAFRLVVQLNDRALRFPLGPGEHELGSAPECAIRIGHPTVSRRHALVDVRDGVVTVTDLGSPRPPESPRGQSRSRI